MKYGLLLVTEFLNVSIKPYLYIAQNYTLCFRFWVFSEVTISGQKCHNYVPEYYTLSTAKIIFL